MDAIKRQADADAIRHAAKLIEAVTIEAQTNRGKVFAESLLDRRDKLVERMKSYADLIYREQP